MTTSSKRGPAPRGQILNLEVETVPLVSLRVSERNPRRGDVAAIKASLVENAQYQPIVVRRSTGEVLAGNHRVLAARELGWVEIAACLVDVDDQRARRILLADNRTSDLAGYDSQALIDLLEELDGGFVGTGYVQADLDALLDEASAAMPVADDAIPELPVEPVSRVGDVIRLGEHRLVCGDCRDAGVVEAVMVGERAGVLLTDPPYGVSYEGRTQARLRLQHDDDAGLAGLLVAAFGVVDECLEDGAAVYVFHPAGALAAEFLAAFSGRWELRQQLVWVKDAMVLGHSDYHYQHEPILYGFKSRVGGGRLGRGGEGWHGDNRQVSVFEVPRPRASRDHPTAKPVELLARFLRNSSGRGDVVVDPFAGSGSTLLACEALGRRARLVEIDPRYCDVIVSRWEAATGRRAEREAV